MGIFGIVRFPERTQAGLARPNDAAKFFCQMRQYKPYTPDAPFPEYLRLSMRQRSSKRSSTRNADLPAEIRSKESIVATSVTLAIKDLSFPSRS